MDTAGPEQSVLIREVSLFQRLKCTQTQYLGREMCPVQRGVLNSGCPVSLYMLILCNGIAGSLVYQYCTYAARVPVGGASSAGEDERRCSGKWTEADGAAESREAAEGAASWSEFMCMNIDIHIHLLHHSYVQKHAYWYIQLYMTVSAFQLADEYSNILIKKQSLFSTPTTSSVSTYMYMKL